MTLLQIESVFADKTVKPSEKTGILVGLVHAGIITSKQLLEYAGKAKDAALGSCIEAITHLSEKEPERITPEWFAFVTEKLKCTAPRVKWESARAIANSCRLYPGKLEPAVVNLLENTEHEGTVVRWSAATALASIILLKTPMNKELLPAINAIMDREEKNSIRKIYGAAIKKSL